MLPKHLDISPSTEFCVLVVVKNILGNSGLIRGDVHLARQDIRAERQLLDGRRRAGPRCVAEALDRSDLGLRDAMKLVAPGRVDGNRDRLAGLDLLERAGGKACTLVVDVDALERKCVALWICC